MKLVSAHTEQTLNAGDSADRIAADLARELEREHGRLVEVTTRVSYRPSQDPANSSHPHVVIDVEAAVEH